MRKKLKETKAKEKKQRDDLVTKVSLMNPEHLAAAKAWYESTEYCGEGGVYQIGVNYTELAKLSTDQLKDVNVVSQHVQDRKDYRRRYTKSEINEYRRMRHEALTANNKHSGNDLSLEEALGHKTKDTGKGKSKEKEKGKSKSKSKGSGKGKSKDKSKSKNKDKSSSASSMGAGKGKSKKGKWTSLQKNNGKGKGSKGASSGELAQRCKRRTIASEQESAELSADHISLREVRFFNDLLVGAPIEDFFRFLDYKQLLEQVYVVEEYTARHPVAGEVPCPIVLLLGGPSKKHLFRCRVFPNLKEIGESIVDFSKPFPLVKQISQMPQHFRCSDA